MIPGVTITRVAWSPFKRERWHVAVTRGHVTYGVYARWHVEAVREAIQLVWGHA